MENPRHLSGSRIRPGTVIERSQIKFVIFKMQEDVNGVLARMINTSACKQPSNVSTLRCKMNGWKAPLMANIPRAQSPFLPRRAVIPLPCPACPRCSHCSESRGQPRCHPAARALGHPLGICLPWVRCASGLGFGAVVKIPIPSGSPRFFVARLG